MCNGFNDSQQHPPTWAGEVAQQLNCQLSQSGLRLGPPLPPCLPVLLPLLAHSQVGWAGKILIRQILLIAVDVPQFAFTAPRTALLPCRRIPCCRRAPGCRLPLWLPLREPPLQFGSRRCGLLGQWRWHASTGGLEG